MPLTAQEKMRLGRAKARVSNITQSKLKIEATLETDPKHPRAADYKKRLDEYADGLVRWGTEVKVLTARAKESA